MKQSTYVVLLWLVLQWLVGCCAPAECADGTTEIGGVYECTTDLADGAIAQGSCVAIARNTYLTIGHQVKDATTIKVRRGKNRDVVRIKKRFESTPEAVILLQDEGKHKPHKVYPISRVSVTEGQACWMIGYQFGSWRDAPCKVDNVTGEQIIFSPMPDHGMSGGALVNLDGELLAIISGKDSQRRQGIAVSVTSVRLVEPLQQWICGPGGCRPPQNYIRRERIIPHVFRPPTVYREEQSFVPTPQQQAPAATCNCAECGVDMSLVESIVKQELARIWAAERDSLRGQDGRPGQDAPEVTVQQIASYLVQNYREELRGAAGDDGSNGVGVDLTAIETRLGRIEAQRRPFLLTGDPGKWPDRRRIDVNGESRALVDEEFYRAGDAMILDLRKIAKAIAVEQAARASP